MCLRRLRRIGGAALLGALACACIVAPLRAAQAAADAPVALPPFFVEEATKGPPWRYGQAVGYEILSRCDDASTRRVIETHHRLHQLLAEILSPALQLTWTLPRTLILYDDELQPAASREVIARLLRDKTEPPPLELELPGGRGPRTVLPARRISFLPNLRLWDRDGMAVFMIVRREGFDPERLALTFDYVAFLVRNRVPALPPWFVSGFLELYREIEYEGGALRGKPLRWISEELTEAVKKDPQTAPGVAPLEAFFTGAIPVAEGEAVPATKRWQAQAALFVRWGLEPRERGRREAFWKFVERCANEGASERVFEACFGFDYAAAQAQLAGYLPHAVRRGATYRPERYTKVPALALALATDAQIARLKGDWERLEVPYVKAISPELTDKYLEQARRTLRRGYERAPSDPQLLAVLGLCEVDAGNEAEARRWLEQAAELGPIRPRANYELARLRLAALRASTAGAGREGLSAGELAEVLRPLFAAREAQPPLPEVYELIAEAWWASRAVPTRRHLAVLDEGVRFFPWRVALVLRAAELNLRHGFRKEAEVLAELAARIATEESERVRLAALRAELGK